MSHPVVIKAGGTHVAPMDTSNGPTRGGSGARPLVAHPAWWKRGLRPRLLGQLVPHDFGPVGEGAQLALSDHPLEEDQTAVGR
jgi:hypothetical protein